MKYRSVGNPAAAGPCETGPFQNTYLNRLELYKRIQRRRPSADAASGILGTQQERCHAPDIIPIQIMFDTCAVGSIRDSHESEDPYTTVRRHKHVRRDAFVVHESAPIHTHTRTHTPAKKKNEITYKSIRPYVPADPASDTQDMKAKSIGSVGSPTASAPCETGANPIHIIQSGSNLDRSPRRRPSADPASVRPRNSIKAVPCTRYCPIQKCFVHVRRETSVVNTRAYRSTHHYSKYNHVRREAFVVARTLPREARLCWAGPWERALGLTRSCGQR